MTRLYVGCGQVVCWSTKATISLKHVKIVEKLLWRAYRNSPTLFRTVSSPTAYGLLFPKMPHLGEEEAVCGLYHILFGWTPVRNPHPKLQCYLRNAGIATEFKFGRYIHRVYPYKSPLKILEKTERGRIGGLPKFWGVPPVSQEWVKLRTSNFVRTFKGSIGTKAHKNFAKSSPGRSQGLPKM